MKETIKSYYFLIFSNKISVLFTIMNSLWGVNFFHVKPATNRARTKYVYQTNIYFITNIHSNIAVIWQLFLMKKRDKQLIFTMVNYVWHNIFAIFLCIVDLIPRRYLKNISLISLHRFKKYRTLFECYSVIVLSYWY